jgi:colicin import membrane protein
MPKQPKPTVTVHSTKNEIFEAYKELLTNLEETPRDETTTQTEEKQTLQTASEQTSEKILTDLSHLKLAVNKEITNLTEKLTTEAERLATIQKAIAIAQKELEQTQKIKITASQLYDLIAVQKQQEQDFKTEIETQRKAWEEEKKLYEETKKRERTREEEEYEYNKKLQRRRDTQTWEEEKQKHQRQQQEEQQLQQNMTKELNELKKTVAEFPTLKDKEIKTAVAQALAQANKDAQISQNFAKQEADAKLKLAQAQIISLETTLKSYEKDITELKHKLEEATKNIKDIAISVVEGNKKEPQQPPKSPTQQ